MAPKIGGGRVLPLVGLVDVVSMNPFRASARVNTNLLKVSINAAIQQSISASVGVATVNPTLLAVGVAKGDNTVPFIANWNPNPGLASAVILLVYSALPARVVSDGTNTAPNSIVLGGVSAPRPTSGMALRGARLMRPSWRSKSDAAGRKTGQGARL